MVMGDIFQDVIQLQNWVSKLLDYQDKLLTKVVELEQRIEVLENSEEA